MGILLLIVIAITLVIIFIKASKKPGGKEDTRRTGEEIYKKSKIFLSQVSNANLSDAELQKIMTFMDGFDKHTEKEKEYRKQFISELGYNIMSKNPRILVRIRNGELDSFMYSNDAYTLSLNRETKDLEVLKIK